VRLVLIAFITFLFSMLSKGFTAELTVSSAMGVKELVVEIGNVFEKETGNKVNFNFSSSGKLAKQIEFGAPSDVYISASEFWMDYLVKRGVICGKSVSPFARTKLVLVAPKGSSLVSLDGAERIAIGNKLAPVGKYALETLKNLGLYERIKERLVFAPTVRQITIWVITGNADAGIIYYSDYLKFKDKLKLLRVFPESSHRPIRFYVGVICSSRNGNPALDFKRFLLFQDEKLYRKFGFFKMYEGE